MSSDAKTGVRTFVLRYDAGPVPSGYSYEIRGALDNGVLQVACELEPGERRPRGAASRHQEVRALHWEGTLDESWYTEAVGLIAHTGLSESGAGQARPPGAARFEVTLSPGTAAERRGVPDNRTQWQQLAEEILDAARQKLGHEAPGTIRYAVIAPSGARQLLELRYDPASRTVQVSVHAKASRNTSPVLDVQAYRRTREILRSVAYYGAGRVGETLPDRPGSYVDRGNGKWYALENGVGDPSGRSGAKKALEAHFSTLLKAEPAPQNP